MEAPTVVTGPQKATSVWQDASNERITQQNESVNSEFENDDTQATYSPSLSATDEGESDIRFSLSDVPAKDLVRENKELKRIVEDLEAQFTVTRGKRISNTRIQSIARAIKSEYTSDISTFEIVDALRALNNYLAASKTTSGTEVFNEFAKLAEEIYDSAFVEMGDAVGTPVEEILRNVRTEGNILLTEAAEQEVRNVYGSLKDFRNAMRKYGLSFVRGEGNEGTWIDVVYGDLSGALAGYIEGGVDVTDADMPIRIADALAKVEKLREPVNIFDVDGISKNDAIGMITADVLGRFMDAPDFRTFADRKQEEFNRANRSYNKRLDQQRNRYETAKVRRQIENATKRLNTLLDSDRISSRAKDNARDFLTATRDLLRMGHSLEKAKNLVYEAISGAQEVRKEYGGNVEIVTTTKDGKSKKETYNVSNFFQEENAALDGGLSDSQAILPEMLADKSSLSELSLAELQELNSFVQQILASNKLINEMFSFQKGHTLDMISENVAADMRETVANEKLTRKSKGLVATIESFLNKTTLDPIRIAMTIGNEFEKIVSHFMDGENIYADRTRAAEDLAVRLMEKYGMEHLLQYDENGILRLAQQHVRDKKNAVTLKLSGGEVTLTQSQLMSLYAAKKNEMTDGKTRHLTEGGFRFTEDDMTRPVAVSDADFEVICAAMRFLLLL
ncbi:MAG: hypothetical protein J6J21_01340, partial [Clostridia bacterium]|nr:hypothetical protein [Clostridia bacterium]